MEIKVDFKLKSFGVFAVSLLLACSACTSKPVAQSTNPCLALKLPLCRLKSDFAIKHGITNKPPIRETRPKLKSALLRPTSTAGSIVTNDKHSVKVDDGKSLLSILGSRPAFQPKQESIGNKDNSNANNSCKGLRFCVLKKDVPANERRPDTSSIFVPKVQTPKEPVFFQEDVSSFLPSLLPLIRDGKIEEAKELIEKGADVNEADRHGNTLLLIAAQNGRADIIADLLLGGANVNYGNSHKNSAIHLAAQNGWEEVMKILLKAKKINVNFKDLHANTALHLAAQNGQTAIIELLLERPELELDSKNTHRHVPLHLTAQNGHVELSRILAQAGSDLDSQDLIGNTPLHTAYHTSHTNIANLLIGLGASENKRNKAGLTPVQLGKRR